MKIFAGIFLLVFFSFELQAQRVKKDYHLKHTIKQENQQFEFHVLDFNDKGVYQYSKAKFYYWLKAQQVHATQGYSSGLLLHGEFQAFYENKQLAQRGYFYKGLKNGEWLYWDQEGVLIHIENWKSGTKVGIEKFFDNSGKIIKKNTFHPRKTRIETPDSLVVKHNKRDKERILVFDAKHRKVKQISRLDEKLHGKQKEYKEGKCVLVEKYKKGEKIERKSLKTIFKRSNKTEDKPKKERKSKNESQTKQQKPANQKEKDKTKKKSFSLFKKSK